SHVDEIVGLTSLKDFAAQLKQINRVTIVACGTSLHAGLIGKYYFEQFARVPTEVDYASEFRYRIPVTDKDGLFVFISQSGETADTLAALREMKARAVPTVVITNVRESSLDREADIVLYTNAGPE